MARTDVTPAQRLDDAFAERTNALVMPFLVCGYPDGDTFVDIAAAAAEAGGGVLEIGIPFSDPIMDGPVIQEATNAVLAKGQRTAGAIELIARAVASYADGVIVGSAVVKRISGSSSPARDVGAFVSDLVTAVLST